MDMDKVEKAFFWIMFVLGSAFFGTAFFMKSGIDIAMRTVFGGVMAMAALSEICPGIISRTCKGLISMIVSACVGLAGKIRRSRGREAINETDIIETKRF